MKIVFTGGGTGGHFYPIIAIAEALADKVHEKRILPPRLYFMSPSKYNPRALFDNDIEFIQVRAGKIRRYFSILNFTDVFTTLFGIVTAFFKLFAIYPDVVFSKGGYASFPTLVAARLLFIPVVIHESDSTPGKVSRWSAKFAQRIALSYPEAAGAFPEKSQRNIAFTGNPIRKSIIEPMTQGAHEFLNLENETPVILILGGSQGSQNINEAVLQAVPELIKRYQIIHQTGRNNLAEIQRVSSLVLKDNPMASRYHTFDYLNDLAMRMSAGVANIVVSRAGSTIFEIASWGLPSIIVPLSSTVSHDQFKNAFSFAHTGACAVIEDENLSANILIEEIDRIITNPNTYETMRQNAKKWSHADAAQKIAEVLLEIGLKHE